METLKRQLIEMNSLGQSAKNQALLPQPFEIVKVLEVKKGTICLVKSRICRVVQISRSKPGKHGTLKYVIKAQDIFLGNWHEQIYKHSHDILRFTIQKTSYLLLSDSSQKVILQGIRSDGQGQILQIGLDVQLQNFQHQLDSFYINEDSFKIQNYLQIGQQQKLQRKAFIEKALQFLEINNVEGKNEIHFDVVSCFGYSAIVGFRQNSKQLRLQDFKEIDKKCSNIDSQYSNGLMVYQNYANNSNNFMESTIKNLLAQELSSLERKQEKIIPYSVQEVKSVKVQMGIQSDSYLRQNQLKEIHIQKLTVQCDQTQMYGRAIPQEGTQQIYKHFLCPISSEMMKKPVILTSCGHTFDKQMITRWIKQRTQACPICVKKTTLKEIIPNFILTDLIATFLQFGKKENQIK